jgi:selenocysteine-specific elongation factor
LKDRARVHFHAYTSETIATVSLLALAKNARIGHPTTQSQVGPQEARFAELRLAEPVLLLPGDRFIIRQFSPVVTIGGGVVLDAAPLPRSRKNSTEGFLEILAKGEPESILTARIARRLHQGLSIEQAIAETGWRREVVLSHLELPISSGTILRVGDFFVHTDAIQNLKRELQNRVAEFQKRNPLVAGISKEALREDFGLAIFSAALDMLVRDKKLAISGDIVHLYGHGVVMKDEEAESKKVIEDAFASSGLKVPALKDVLATLKLDKTRAQKIVTLLLRDKVLVKISEELVFHRDALEALRKKLAAERIKSAKLDVARFKEMTGVSRKYAIPLLEYLDRERVTKRLGDERVIV